MRLSFALGSAVVSMVLAVFACSSEVAGGNGSSGGPDLPDGATITEDGAIVDPDGNVIDPADTSPPSKVNVTTENVDVAGISRSYVLAVPRTYDAARSYPLVIAMHGDGESAGFFRGFSGVDDVTGDDAIVAYPDNVVELYTPYDQNVDQQLIEATINAVKGKYNVEANKVWGFGYSKGGFIGTFVACRKPGLFKAVALHASGAPRPISGGAPECPGVIGLPVLASAGEGDLGIGGEDNAQYWASVNGCSGSRSPTSTPSCEKYDGCPADKPVVYCQPPGVNHYPIWGQAAQVSWAWFKTL